jgi:hypothetical protein
MLVIRIGIQLVNSSKVFFGGLGCPHEEAMVAEESQDHAAVLSKQKSTIRFTMFTAIMRPTTSHILVCMSDWTMIILKYAVTEW